MSGQGVDEAGSGRVGVPELLEQLLEASAPSGYEGPAADVWRRAASFARLSTDRIGSSIAAVGTSPPLLAVVGHIDEIGLVVTYIDEQGFVNFTSIGDWDPQVLVGQRVEVRGVNGPVSGVIGRPPVHLLDPDQRRKVGELHTMQIDIGVSSKEQAGALVRVGDPVVVAATPVTLAGDRLASRALDNRLGAYVALESLRRFAAHDDAVASFAAVASVQEEIGLFGARTSASQIRPDLAIVIDVTHAGDAPGVDKQMVGEAALGCGAVIGRGSTVSEAVYRLLVETAEAEGIPYTVLATGTSTSTDVDAVQISGPGVPTGLVKIPIRYMHSPVETVDLTDVEAAVRLVSAFARRLDGTALIEC